jgi:hypothetical protein
MRNTMAHLIDACPGDQRPVACCRFHGHEDKIVTDEPENGYDETEVQS